MNVEMKMPAGGGWGVGGGVDKGARLGTRQGTRVAGTRQRARVWGQMVELGWGPDGTKG